MTEQEEFEFRARLESELAPKAPKSRESSATTAGRKSAGLGIAAAQGATMGFGDEIAGAIMATLKGVPGLDEGAEGSTWRQRYEGYRDFNRGAEKETNRQSPVAATVVNALASTPGAVAIGAPASAIKAVGVGANALRAAVSGGAVGAASGAGRSEENALGGVAMDAARDGVLSAALGGVTSPIAGALGAIGRNAGQRMSQSWASDYARQKVAEALVRDARGTVAQESGDVARQASARINKLGPSAMVADAGGKNTMGLLDTLATLPGRTKDWAEAAIKTRQSGRADRLIGAADDALGAHGQRAAATVEDLIAQRSEASRPLYEAVHKMSVERTDALDSIIAAAQKLGAESSARKIATAERVPYTLTDKVAKPAGTSGVMGVAAPAPAKSYSMRDLDLLKQGLDDKIAAAVNEFGRPTNVGVALIKLKNSLLSTLDESTGGAYAQARQAFAGPSAVMDAVKQGRRAMTQDDAAIGAAVRGLSPSELDGFRIGAFEALRAKLGGQSGQTQILKMWREPATQEKLKAIFGSERAYREFAATAAREARLMPLEGVGRGSQTAARQFGAGDLDVSPLTDIAGAGGAAAQGNALGLLASGARVWNRVSTPETVRDQMGRILMTQGQQGQQEINALADLVRRVNDQRNGRSVAAGISAAELMRLPMQPNQ